MWFSHLSGQKREHNMWNHKHRDVRDTYLLNLPLRSPQKDFGFSKFLLAIVSFLSKNVVIIAFSRQGFQQNETGLGSYVKGTQEHTRTHCESRRQMNVMRWLSDDETIINVTQYPLSDKGGLFWAKYEKNLPMK